LKSELLFAKPHHPLLVTPAGDASLGALLDYFVGNKMLLQQLLLQHGGILFRGYQLNGSADFAACVASLSGTPFSYVGGNSPRTHVEKEVYTSTEHPASDTISLHHEMSYLPVPPKRIFFYCEEPSKMGGQTSLANSLNVLHSIPSEIVEEFRRKKLNYIRTFHPEGHFGKSWQETYFTDDIDEALDQIESQGSIYRWLDDGSLQVSTLLDAVITHPESGDDVWFNQAEQWHPSALRSDVRVMFEKNYGNAHFAHHCEYGDGTPLDEDRLREIRGVLNENKLLFKWEKNDLLMLDNVLMMHGRESFEGKRKVLTYLSVT